MSQKPLVLFGAGKVTEVIYRHLLRQGRHKVAAFTCDAAYLPDSGTYLDRPVVAFDRVVDAYPPSSHDMLVAIGYHQLNGVRRRIYGEAKAKGYALASFVSDLAGHGDWLQTGDNCLILDNASIEPGVTIGNNVVIWSGALIGHHTTIEDHCWIAGHAVFGGGARLGSGSFVGLGAILGNEVEIGADSFLGAGVLVTKCMDPKSVFVARDTERFRLDSDHFMKISKIR